MTLDDGTTTITLPDSLEWVNEFDFTYVQRDIQRTIGGSLVVQSSEVIKGRTIQLEGGENVWVKREVITQLFDWANDPEKQMTLTFADARTMTVIFNSENGAPISAKPVWRKNIQESDDTYTLGLSLLEV